MEEKVLERVTDSYRRCYTHEEFLDDFYIRFMNSSAEVRELFKNTDFPRQKKIVGLALMSVFMYASAPDNPIVKRQMQRLAKSHDHAHHNVRPKLYDLWLDCLLESVNKYDENCTEDILECWRECLSPAIEYMQGKY